METTKSIKWFLRNWQTDQHQYFYVHLGIWPKITDQLKNLFLNYDIHITWMCVCYLRLASSLSFLWISDLAVTNKLLIFFSNVSAFFLKSDSLLRLFSSSFSNPAILAKASSYFVSSWNGNNENWNFGAFGCYMYLYYSTKSCLNQSFTVYSDFLLTFLLYQRQKHMIRD